MGEGGRSIDHKFLSNNNVPSILTDEYGLLDCIETNPSPGDH